MSRVPFPSFRRLLRFHFLPQELIDEPMAARRCKHDHFVAKAQDRVWLQALLRDLTGQQPRPLDRITGDESPSPWEPHPLNVGSSQDWINGVNSDNCSPCTGILREQLH